MWNVLESQRLRFMEGALTGTPFTQADQQRPYEVHEKLPAMQDPIRGWERQVIVQLSPQIPEFLTEQSFLSNAGHFIHALVEFVERNRPLHCIENFADFTKTFR